MDPHSILTEAQVILCVVVGPYATRTTRDILFTTEYNILRVVYGLKVIKYSSINGKN